RQRVRLGSRYAVLSGVPLSVARHLRLLPLARGGGGRTDLVREHVVSPAIEGLVVRNFLTAVLAGEHVPADIGQRRGSSQQHGLRDPNAVVVKPVDAFLRPFARPGQPAALNEVRHLALYSVLPLPRLRRRGGGEGATRVLTQRAAASVHVHRDARAVHPALSGAVALLVLADDLAQRVRLPHRPQEGAEGALFGGRVVIRDRVLHDRDPERHVPVRDGRRRGWGGGEGADGGVE